MANSIYGLEEILLGLSQKHDGDYEKVYNALATKERLTDDQISDYLDDVIENYTTVVSENYPQAFKSDMDCPPIVMYYVGNLSLIDNEFRELANPANKEKRFFASVEPSEEGMDYVVGCENQKDLRELVENIIKTHPEINFIDYLEENKKEPVLA